MDRSRVKTISFVFRNGQYFTFNINRRDWIKKEGIWHIIGWQILGKTTRATRTVVRVTLIFHQPKKSNY